LIQGSYALVAVGSTRFDALIQAIDCPEFVAALKKLGFEELHVQKGTGEYVPTTITKAPNFRVVVFEFTHDWKKEVENAGLVIGHAGEHHIFFVCILLLLLIKRLLITQVLELY